MSGYTETNVIGDTEDQQSFNATIDFLNLSTQQGPVTSSPTPEHNENTETDDLDSETETRNVANDTLDRILMDTSGFTKIKKELAEVQIGQKITHVIPQAPVPNLDDSVVGNFGKFQISDKNFALEGLDTTTDSIVDVNGPIKLFMLAISPKIDCAFDNAINLFGEIPTEIIQLINYITNKASSIDTEGQLEGERSGSLKRYPEFAHAVLDTMASIQYAESLSSFMSITNQLVLQIEDGSATTTNALEVVKGFSA